VSPRDFLDLIEDLVYALVSALIWAAVIVPYAFVVLRLLRLLTE